MKKILLSVIMIFGIISYGSSQTKVGTTAATFLQIGAGGRNIAMGETVGASAIDVSSSFWNPALIANLKRYQVYFNHINWFADINLEYGAVLLNLGNLGNVAASFYSMNSGQIEVTTEERPEGTGEKYDVQDLMVGITYGRALTDRFNIGGTFKFIHSAIWNMSASAIAIDLGITYQTPLSPIIIGMSISNFGSEMQMRGTDTAIRFDPDPRVSGNNDGVIGYQATRSWDLPVNMRFGISYKLFSSRFNKLIFNTDVLYPNNNDNYINLGAEYSLFDNYFIRAGYRQLFLAKAEGGLSLGAGFIIQNIQLDYAFCNRNRLDSIQYFAIGLLF